VSLPLRAAFVAAALVQVSEVPTADPLLLLVEPLQLPLVLLQVFDVLGVLVLRSRSLEDAEGDHLTLGQGLLAVLDVEDRWHLAS